MNDPIVFFADRTGLIDKFVDMSSNKERASLSMTWINSRFYRVHLCNGFYHCTHEIMVVSVEDRTTEQICATITHEFIHHILNKWFGYYVTKSYDKVKDIVDDWLC